MTLYDYLNNQDDKKYILLLDEPNLYLHPGAQRNLLFNVFKNEFINTQVIYTTHSPYMIDSDNSYSIRIVEKNKESYIFNSPTEYAQKNPKMKDVDTTTPLLTALELNISNSLIVDCNDILITVEGIQDVYILNAMLKITKNTKKFENVKFISGMSANKIPYLYSYLYGIGYNVYALVDNDNDGRKAIMDIIDNDKEDERLEKLFMYDLANSSKTDFLLENLFSANDKERYLPNKSTIFYKRIYDNYSDIEFEKETIHNFKVFFDVLSSKVL